jgi:acyl-coenzyme A synthetase/AMP-(fatty) acid ligase
VNEDCVGEFEFECHNVNLSAATPEANVVSLDDSRAPWIHFYTSGSSGHPKLIEKPLSSLEAETLYWCERFEGQADRICGTVSHQHIYGFLFRFLLPILSKTLGADSAALAWEVLLGPSNSANNTLIVSSPAHLTRLPPKDTLDGHTISICLSSGAPLPFEAAHNVEDLMGVLPIEIFGSTETGGVASRQQHTQNEAWEALPHIRISQSHEEELLIASPLFTTSDPLPMGDKAKLIDDRKFQLLGRMDLIAKVEGKRVSLTRVSDLLLSHPHIDDAIAVVTEQNGRERLSAVIVPNDEGRRALIENGTFRYSRSIGRALSDNLEPSEIPKRWRFVNDIPLNSQSKKSRLDIAKLFDAARIKDMFDLDIEYGPDFSATITFKIPEDMRWLEGHFPNLPVMPGLSQVHIAACLCEELWAYRPKSLSVTKLKFNKVAMPHEELVLNLSFSPDTQKLKFEYLRSDDAISSGIIG